MVAMHVSRTQILRKCIHECQNLLCDVHQSSCPNSPVGSLLLRNVRLLLGAGTDPQPQQPAHLQALTDTIVTQLLSWWTSNGTGAIPDLSGQASIHHDEHTIQTATHNCRRIENPSTDNYTCSSWNARPTTRSSQCGAACVVSAVAGTLDPGVDGTVRETKHTSQLIVDLGAATRLANPATVHDYRDATVRLRREFGIAPSNRNP